MLKNPCSYLRLTCNSVVYVTDCLYPGHPLNFSGTGTSGSSKFLCQWALAVLQDWSTLPSLYLRCSLVPRTQLAFYLAATIAPKPGYKEQRTTDMSTKVKTFAQHDKPQRLDSSPSIRGDISSMQGNGWRIKTDSGEMILMLSWQPEAILRPRFTAFLCYMTL